MAGKKSSPLSPYPASPHTVGTDWVEIAVRQPAKLARLYVSLGFTPRSSGDGKTMVAMGGLVLALKRTTRTGASGGMTIQIAVDDVDAKRQGMRALGLRPGPLRRQRRGDRCFQWRGEDGPALRFVGPVRRPSDPKLD